MQERFGFSIAEAFFYENGFYLTSHVKRVQKLIAHYELYKTIINIPGDILEFGVFKGASLLRFAQFRDILETSYSRKIVGFDAFGEFPLPLDNTADQHFIEKFTEEAGCGIPVDDLQFFIDNKGIANIDLVKGNILATLPSYLEKHPQLRISLLHIDVDVYEPTRFILDRLYDRVVSGGIIIFDDYATVAGETDAVDQFLVNKNLRLLKPAASHVPSYIVIP